MSDEQLTWKDNQIRDGLAQRYYIEEFENLYGSLEFWGRPFLPIEVEETEQLIAKSEPTKAMGRLFRELADRVTKWSNDFEISVDNMRKCRHQHITRMYEMLAGKRPSDPIPYSRDDKDDPDLIAANGPSHERIRETLGKS